LLANLEEKGNGGVTNVNAYDKSAPYAVSFTWPAAGNAKKDLLEEAMTYGTLGGRYPATSKLLHWLVAVCVLVTIPIAIWMTNVEKGPFQDSLYNLHKSIGVLILILMLLRLANRLIVGAPAPDPALEPWQRSVSSTVHTLLYVLLLAMPIVGYTANSAYGASTPFFGLFELPPVVGKNEDLSKLLFMLHRWTGYAVAALALLHIGAALQHYFIRRDGVLQRMLPGSAGFSASAR
jgi:cytochrome b561